MPLFCKLKPILPGFVEWLVTTQYVYCIDVKPV